MSCLVSYMSWGERCGIAVVSPWYRCGIAMASNALALGFPLFGRHRGCGHTFSSVSMLRTLSHYAFQCLGAADALGLRFPMSGGL